jgi:ubiquinone/menaquinone biosynthesis C-methylase UbiE
VERIPEPELMDDDEQAAAYAGADFGEAHAIQAREVASLLQSHGLDRGDILDLACGPGDITCRISELLPQARLTGVDGSAAMLRLARQRAEEGGLSQRVAWVMGMIPGVSLPQRFDAILCTGSLHHFRDPGDLWRAMIDFGRPCALVYVIDLRRPASMDIIDRMVEERAGGEPEVYREDFRNSLRAAYEPRELVEQTRELAFDLEIHEHRDLYVRAVGRLASPSSRDGSLAP